jgi:hypothetical protein
VNEEGGLIDMPINVRASCWLRHDSEMSKQGELTERGILVNGGVTQVGAGCGDACLDGEGERPRRVTPCLPWASDTPGSRAAEGRRLRREAH